MKPTEPHKPHCAYLCSGEELRECDCGVVPQRSVTLALGVRSARLLVKAIGRLDSDDIREAEGLGLTKTLEKFLAEKRP